MISAHMFSAQTMLVSPIDACKHSARLSPGSANPPGSYKKAGWEGGGGGGAARPIQQDGSRRLTAMRKTRRVELSGICSALNLER